MRSRLARPHRTLPHSSRKGLDIALLLGALATSSLSGCSGAEARPAPVPAAPAKATPTVRPAPGKPLDLARAALETSRYSEAEAGFRRIVSDANAKPDEALAARLGLAETLLLTGRYEDAARLAREASQKPAPPNTGISDPRSSLIAVGAEALRRTGALEEALALLETASPTSLDALLVRGEIELLGGRRQRAESALLAIITSYNDGQIAETDGRSLAVVGRAAHLLRSPHDANDAFDEAEQATPGDVRTLLWRGELYLEKYDIAHATEVVEEARAKAPAHPEALVQLAHVRLAETLDFDAAEELARQALAVDRRLAGAYFVLGGIALRDEDLAAADRHIAEGLRHNPRDLELLSLRATVRFLADDKGGFERQISEVLAQNPEYTRLFQIIGEYADWEHRYDDIVQLMRRAVRIDADDGKARADLGLNLIRSGQDAAGVVELRRAFEADPFNVRVVNTLELYEKVVPRDYDDTRAGRFRIRYPKRERALLERYVPTLLDRAWAKLKTHYGFEPETPVGIELYEKRDQFAVRTSGLPQTEIQGVCFGHTLATISPGGEPANLGMTLWHELSHVFHIQLSKSHVPRWLTEGLAEHETATERTEWKRELDPQLYDAIRNKRLPPVASLSRAFTRAENMSDVATAYYASNRIADFIAERYGMKALAELLAGYGQGQTTPDAVQAALGVSVTELDTQFRAGLETKLARYSKQFVPLTPRGALAALREAAQKSPNDPKFQVAYALRLADEGREEDAERLLDTVLRHDPKEADALFARARLALAADKPNEAKRYLEKLLEAQRDGYEVQMLFARAARAHDNDQELQKHLEQASAFDPENSEPLLPLLGLYREAGDTDRELSVLRRLATLEEHLGDVHRRLLELLVERKDFRAAETAGEAALWANLGDLQVHLLYARALEGVGNTERALFELESATLCEAPPNERAEAFDALAAAQARRGRATEAKKAREEAARLRAGAK
jgi:predicted Zn-dependent protease